MNKCILPSTVKKAAYHTCNKVNQDIRYKTVNCISVYKDGGNAVLSDRIERLNREWDIERVLETNAASVILLSSIMGYKKKKCGWFLITGTVGIFLLQHALQGWCPPLPFIRKLGIRTAEEINQEKTALKLIRGDISGNTDDADDLLKAAEK
jgi:hypothetical protein